MPTPNHHPPPGKPGDENGHSTTDLLADAEAVRDLLDAAGTKLAALIGTLKRQRKQSKAFRQAVQSIRKLPTFDL